MSPQTIKFVLYCFVVSHLQNIKFDCFSKLVEQICTCNFKVSVIANWSNRFVRAISNLAQS